ncbi:PQQ-binding-like beta-propeller repeat protein [Kribbella sp. NPDC051620]|uniref:outer membrane protein assembly factor BamB family protein n=1 Tax=Kribbella sp. NPDC051620 TaxID=3364120 RepID=UPI0037BA8D21
MPDSTVAGSTVADSKHRPASRRTVAAVVVLAAAAVLGVLTIVFDWGWPVWIATLAVGAIALVVAFLRTRPVLRSAAVLTAVALVVTGILVVRIPPMTPSGWKVEPDVRLIAADEKLAVTLDQQTGEVQGRAIDDGNQLWKNGFGGSGSTDWKQLGTDAVLLFDDSGSSQRDNRAAVISIADGKTRWSQDVGRQEPFTANDTVVVFTGDKTTTGIDLATGKKLWTHAGEATAGSGGQGSYRPNRWVARSDWIAVRNASGSAPTAVLDVRTGQVATAVRATRSDFVIAGQTFVEFTYAKDGHRLAKGTPLAGGQPWSTPFGRLNGLETLDVVDGRARAVYGTKTVFLDPGTGTLREVPLDGRWSVALQSRVDGRYVAVEQRDRDHHVVATAIADTTTGKLVDVPGRGDQVEASIEQSSDGTAIAHTTVVDAVGGKSQRYTLISDGAEHGQVSTTQGRFASAGDVIKVGGRITTFPRTG